VVKSWFLLASSLALWTSAASAQISLRRVPLGEAVQLAARAASLTNYVIEPEILADQRLVSIKLENASPRSLRAAMDKLGVRMDVMGKLTIFGAKNSPEPAASAARVVDPAPVPAAQDAKGEAVERPSDDVAEISLIVLEVDHGKDGGFDVFASLRGLALAGGDPAPLRLGSLFGVSASANKFTARVSQQLDASVVVGKVTSIVSGLSIPILRGLVDQPVGGVRQDIAYRDVGLSAAVQVTRLPDGQVLITGSLESSSVGSAGVAGSPSFAKRSLPIAVKGHCGELLVVGAYTRDEASRRFRLLGLSRAQRSQSIAVTLRHACPAGRPQRSEDGKAGQEGRPAARAPLAALPAPTGSKGRVEAPKLSTDTP